HDRAAVRARLWPQTMTTLTTHDTKRGEDVRARIGVLSQVPSLWAEFVSGWQRRVPCPDPTTGLFLLQNVFGVWPVDGDVTPALRDRLHGYAEKAIREAGVHTSWNDPDVDFEADVHSWLDAVVDGPVAAELTRLVAQLDPHARSDALGQKLLQLTAPGVPDVYQGTELWEDSLVDPDNRRFVDFALRRKELAALEHPKIRVTAAALRLRRRRPEAFLAGRYRPLLADGAAREHVVAFGRGDDVVVAVGRWTVRLAESGWADTSLTLPTGSWVELLSESLWTGVVAVGELFGQMPVALLERSDA
ncbi:MAG: malto-oligosyltrehalose synthase, partial [Mycobacteriaceae bacterium]|nr:malto-oligosyltrehalose synthase [Mycobacteriaceae bacterium]